MDYILTSEDEITKLVKSNGICSWDELTEYIRNLPYGRNENRTDLGLVLSEKKGTCSSKHALLKSIADSNNISNVDLIMGIYKMNEINTPKIGTILKEKSIEFIPEAHCYLKINGIPIDFTTNKSEFEKIKKDIIEEKKIGPKQIVKFKVDYHKDFIRNWLKATNSEFEFNQIWNLREKCIISLSV